MLVLRKGIHTQQKDIVILKAAAAAAKLLQSCPTLCDPIDGSPPGSPVPGILQARILEWVVIFFSNAWKLKVKVKSLSRVWLRVWLRATPWTAAYKAPLSMGFSRQEYWSGLPLPSLNNTQQTSTFPPLPPIQTTLIAVVWPHRGWIRERPFVPFGCCLEGEWAPISPIPPGSTSAFLHASAQWVSQDRRTT